MPKKKTWLDILILTGSPREDGNSSVLAESFSQGAHDAGHRVSRFDAARRQVYPCGGCYACETKGRCAFDDDFAEVRASIIPADVVVFATPIYYFGMPARLKAVLDRFYGINNLIRIPKKAVLLLCHANPSSDVEAPFRAHYDAFLKYMGWKDAGGVNARGVWAAGAVRDTPFPAQAYELGKSL